ncbi:MAG TPA: ABC transporter substrate-binding protein, partial [Acidimicrobiales bacterium]|nr:ABC transporter substrate-binding protein [Acidimicrobiales bacterium]
MQFLELGSGVTVACLVCEDLARIDEVADLLRAVGPTLVVTILLDGPQLASRWTARYASVLADDPGSTVLTLSAYGMVQGSWRTGQSPSSVVALWKDPVVGLHEIALDADAQGILLTAELDRTIRRSADGRWPVDNTADLHIAGIKQTRATAGHSVMSFPAPGRKTAHRMAAPVSSPIESTLHNSELTVLTSWAEAIAEALATSPAGVIGRLNDARAGGGMARRPQSGTTGRAARRHPRRVDRYRPNGGTARRRAHPGRTVGGGRESKSRGGPSCPPGCHRDAAGTRVTRRAAAGLVNGPSGPRHVDGASYAPADCSAINGLPVSIGVLHDFPAADGGEAFEWAVRLGMAEVGERMPGPVEFMHMAANGLPLPGGSEASVRQAYEQLNGAGVLAVLGPAISDNAIVVRPMADAAGLATVNYAGAEATRSAAGFHYQIGSLEDEPSFLVAHLLARGLTRVALIQDTTFIGRRMAEFFEEACASAGVSLVARATLPPTGANATEALTAVRATGPA